MKKFFNLAELIIVIVIIGLLAMIIIPEISSWQKEAKEVRLSADIRNTQTAVDMYYNKNGVYPSDEDPFFTNMPIDWEKTVPSYLRKKPTLEPEQSLYIDPYGTVTLNYNSHAPFLRWLKESPFLVTNPSDSVYNGMNPPKGAVMHNYNLNTNTFSKYNGEIVIKSFTSAMTGDALIETYQATGDKVFLDRAKYIGDYLKTMTSKQTLYGTSITVINPQEKYNGTSWDRGNSEFYIQDMAASAHFLIELGRFTNDTSYSDKGKELLDTLVLLQNIIKGSTDYPEIHGSLPFYLVNAGGGTVSMTWYRAKYPLDIATFVYDAGNSGVTFFKDTKYSTFKNDYFGFVEKSFKDLKGISPAGYPYEYIYTEAIGNVYGINIDQNNGNQLGPNEPFTTDQFFYLAAGLMKQNSPSAKSIYDKASKLPTGFLFWGQYNTDGSKSTSEIETFNSAVYLEMTKNYNPELGKKIERAMLNYMIKDEANPITNSSWAWAPNEYIIEDLVSAYIPKSIMYQRTLQNVLYK